MVVELLLARDELLAVGRREKEAAPLLVGEELDGESDETVGFQEPAQLTRRDVQLVESVGDVGVVLQVAGVASAPSPPAAVQAASVVGERPEQELGQLLRSLEEVSTAEPASGLG